MVSDVPLSAHGRRVVAMVPVMPPPQQVPRLWQQREVSLRLGHGQFGHSGLASMGCSVPQQSLVRHCWAPELQTLLQLWALVVFCNSCPA